MADWNQESLEFLEFLDILEEENENLYRMPKRKEFVINTILPLVSDKLKKITNRGLPFCPMAQVLIALRFYATGNYQVVSGDLGGASQQSVSRIVKRVSIAIAEHLAEFIHFPTNENLQRQNIVKYLLYICQISGFPAVAACVDCTHIPVANPGGNNGEIFRNRKGSFCINVQVAVGPQMEILDIVVRHPGSSHDSVIFNRSALRVRFEEGQLQGLLLGDNGYPCRSYLLTPVIAPNDQHQRRYNIAHIRTRNIVGRVFGVWKRIFPCLRRTLTSHLNTSVAIICATAVLYNLGRTHFNIPEEELVPENTQVFNTENDNQLGLQFRAEFINQHF